MNCLLCERHSAAEPMPAEESRRYWRCGHCGLVWLDQSLRLKPAEEKGRYLLHENSVASDAYLSYLDRLAGPVTKQLARGARGLDFGCGPSEGMRALLEARGFCVESYDPYFFPRPELLNFRYDFVLCSEAAEHFYFPAEEFARLDSLLLPGGWFGLRTLLLPSPEKFADWHYRRDPTHVVFYAAESLRWIAQRWGWRLHSLDSPIAVFQKR